MCHHTLHAHATVPYVTVHEKTNVNDLSLERKFNERLTNGERTVRNFQ